MANGDVPVDGSAVDVGGSGTSFKITAKGFAEDGNNILVIRTTPGKKLHIFVKANFDDPGSAQFEADLDNDHWGMTISEV